MTATITISSLLSSVSESSDDDNLTSAERMSKEADEVSCYLTILVVTYQFLHCVILIKRLCFVSSTKDFLLFIIY